MASQNEIAIYYSNSIKVTIWRLTLLTATMCSTKNGDHNFLLSGIIICKNIYSPDLLFSAMVMYASQNDVLNWQKKQYIKNCSLHLYEITCNRCMCTCRKKYITIKVYRQI